MAIRKNNSGFTLIEVVAVIGVLAITSAILIANNRLNELQLGLSKDSALIAATVSKAKNLALQNSADAGGYGVRFESDGPDKGSFFIFKDIDVNGYSVGEEKLDKIDLSSGVVFYNPSIEEQSSIIKDLVFYSSDANVKIFNSAPSHDPVSDAGVIILQTDSEIVSSFNTLKITITGQVSSKVGAYVNPANFDAGKESVKQSDGTFTVKEPGNENIANENPDQNLIIYGDELGAGGPWGGLDNPNCVPQCTGKCSGEASGCGGTCICPVSYTCSISTPSNCVIDNSIEKGCPAQPTCNDTDVSGNKCVACLGLDTCQQKNGVFQCVAPRYACNGISCVLDANGPYSTLNCNNQCTVPHYSCNGNSCIADANGAYTSSNCNNSCTTPHYSCNGNSCMPDAAGFYTTSNCDAQCALPRYSCNGNSCISAINGDFISSNCDNSCVGTPHYSCNGNSCIPTINGNFTSANCDNSCVGTPRYSCNGNSCIPTINGDFTTSNCDNSCAVSHYSCNGNSCILDANGSFTNANCDFTCVGTPHYSCNGNSCIPDANGAYTSSDCNNACTTPHYSCNGNSCIADAIGPYTTLNCDNSCVGTPHYSCNGNSCIADVNGAYTSSDCNGQCTVPACTCPAVGDPNYGKCNVKDSCGINFCHLCSGSEVCGASGFCEVPTPLIIESINPPTFIK